MPIKKIKKRDWRAHLYGYTINGEIGVNIQKLWNELKDEDKFIEEFSKTYTHEKLHVLIDEILNDLRIRKEEYIIRSALNEDVSDEVLRYYG